MAPVNCVDLTAAAMMFPRIFYPLLDLERPLKPSIIALPALVLAGALLTGCGDPPTPFDPCTVQPTKQAADGTWVEWDDEPLDADPCDADNFELDAKGHVTNKRKATVTKKPTVTVPTQPAPRPTPARVTTRSTRR